MTPDVPIRRSGSARGDYLAAVDASTRMMQRRNRLAMTAAAAKDQQAIDDALQACINAERAARVYADMQEGQARIAADNAEAAARAQGDAAERDARMSADGYLSGMIDALGASLANEVDARNGADLNEAIARQNADAAEAQARQAGDTANSNAIAKEISDRSAAVSAEASSRQAGDNTLATSIATEAQTRAQADTAEAQARAMADQNEATARQAGDKANSDAITKEISDRSTADTALGTRIDARLKRVSLGNVTVSWGLTVLALGIRNPVDVAVTGLKTDDALVELRPTSAMPAGYALMQAYIKSAGTLTTIFYTPSLTVLSPMVNITFEVVVLRSGT